jgi:hypothetical protein
VKTSQTKRAKKNRVLHILHCHLFKKEFRFMSHVARTDRKPPVNFGYFCNERSTGDFRSVYVTWCSIELGLLPSTLSSTSLLLLKPVNSNLIMSTTAAKNISTNSFGFASSKASNSQKTCHICKRLLYSFEEVLVC